MPTDRTHHSHSPHPHHSIPLSPTKGQIMRYTVVPRRIAPPKLVFVGFSSLALVYYLYFYNSISIAVPRFASTLGKWESGAREGELGSNLHGGVQNPKRTIERNFEEQPAIVKEAMVAAAIKEEDARMPPRAQPILGREAGPHGGAQVVVPNYDQNATSTATKLSSTDDESPRGFSDAGIPFRQRERVEQEANEDDDETDNEAEANDTIERVAPPPYVPFTIPQNDGAMHDEPSMRPLDADELDELDEEEEEAEEDEGDGTGFVEASFRQGSPPYIDVGRNELNQEGAVEVAVDRYLKAEARRDEQGEGDAGEDLEARDDDSDEDDDDTSADLEGAQNVRGSKARGNRGNSRPEQKAKKAAKSRPGQGGLVSQQKGAGGSRKYKKPKKPLAVAREEVVLRPAAVDVDLESSVEQLPGYRDAQGEEHDTRNTFRDSADLPPKRRVAIAFGQEKPVAIAPNFDGDRAIERPEQEDNASEGPELGLAAREGERSSRETEESEVVEPFVGARRRRPQRVGSGWQQQDAPLAL